ncbi:unnamed protein product [Phaeothamnion confervicola]
MVRHGTRLRAVDLGGCFNMSLKGVMDLITRHPNRENFDALQLPGLPLTHEFTAALPANCPNITSLGIGYNQLELLLLEQLLNPLARQLRALRVHWCVTVRDNMLLWIGQSCPRLRFLDVCGCKFVTINGVGTMLQAKQVGWLWEGKRGWSGFDEGGEVQLGIRTEVSWLQYFFRAAVQSHHPRLDR